MTETEMTTADPDDTPPAPLRVGTPGGEFPRSHLKARGWTDDLVDRHLGRCDRVSKRGTRLFAAERVEAAEAVVPEVRDRVRNRPRRFDRKFADILPGVHAFLTGPAAGDRAVVRVWFRGEQVASHQTQVPEAVALARGCAERGLLAPLLDWLVERDESDERFAAVAHGLATGDLSPLEWARERLEAERAAAQRELSEVKWAKARQRTAQERRAREGQVRGEPARQQGAAERRLGNAEYMAAAVEESLAEGVGTEFITVSGLKHRGWTAGMVRTRLGGPDEYGRNPYYRCAAPTNLYARGRVERAEADPACRAAREASLVRRRRQVDRLRAAVADTV